MLFILDSNSTVTAYRLSVTVQHHSYLEASVRWLWKLLHVFYLGRAASRGPRYFARYELRRQARKATYRLTRGPRRRR